MLTHKQFLETYLRTAQDYDLNQSIQCVDLAKLYSDKVLGIKLGAFGGTAVAGWGNTANTFDPKFWNQIPYKAGTVPVQGDIIFFGDPIPYGHVAIVHSANATETIIIEQNGATGDGLGKGYDAINFQAKRNYKKCLGWYHKK